MSKEVELEIKISKTGKVEIVPKGTSGKECLDLMKFLDKIPGFKVKETTPNEDMKRNVSVDVQSNVDIRDQ
jgi:hypothetical protein